MKRRLYSRNPKLIKERIEGKLRDISYGVKTEWKKEMSKPPVDRFKMKPTAIKKFFIFSIVFFLIALAFTAFKFYRGGNTISTENIEINVLGNSFTAGGEELPLQIQITNNNNLPLELSDLLIEYPKGSSGETTGDFVRSRVSVGQIKAGQTVNENAKVTLFGEQGTSKNIKISLEYRVQSSNAIFVKDVSHTVNISSAPISLTVVGPQAVTSGQEIAMTIKINTNASKVAEGILLRVEAPPGFEFGSSEPKTISGDNVWDLGDLASGMEKTVTMRGTMYGQDKEEKSFRFYVGEKDNHDDASIGVVYNSFLHTLAITRPFIEAHLLINGQDQPEFSINNQSIARAQINWVNNLPTKVDDLVIKARITGAALNKNSVTSLSGFYDSASDTVTWDRNTSPELVSVEPGDQGTVDFSFASAPLFSESGPISGSPSITIEVSISAKQPALGNIVSEINNFETKTIKINSDLQLISQALYFEGPLTNSGPIPPKAEQKTTYTLVMSVTNSANAVSNAEVRATLPFYVRYTGVISPSSEDITYNESTKQVLWRLGTVSAGTGLSRDPREVSFQVELSPSISQIGSVPQLLGEAVLTGKDNFSGATLRATRSALNTRLSNDSQFKTGYEVVVQ